jgi:predicted carbohydrate-binding protein with CBM5 and CBM33 domain
MREKMKFNKLAFAITTLLVSGAAWSHGYLMDPPSRALLCNHIKNNDRSYPIEQMNTGCGSIQYEPQSMEANKGYPTLGPVDGRIGSAQWKDGYEMDAQSATRWNKTPMSAGPHQFTWKFTAPHNTTKYEYFITKNDWNPNQVLSRASFEGKPFCTVSRGGERPGQTDSHTCDVPDRQGDQIILAIWTVDDTSNAFYNTADVEFSGNNIGDDGQEAQHKPVIQLAQDKLVVEKSAVNMSYTLDASKSQNVTHYSWEVIDGYSHFQLQDKQGTSPVHQLEGAEMSAPGAWVAADHVGTGTYRLTASNAFGSVQKDIQVEVKDSHETPASSAWAVGKHYQVNDLVTYQGSTYRCLNVHTSQLDWFPGNAPTLWIMVK